MYHSSHGIMKSRHNYPHKPTDYRHTDKRFRHESANGWTDGQTDGWMLPSPLSFCFAKLCGREKYIIRLYSKASLLSGRLHIGYCYKLHWINQGNLKNQIWNLNSEHWLEFCQTVMIMVFSTPPRL